MAITQLSQTAAGTTDFTLLKDEVTKNSKGINQITLSNYDNDSAPVVKVGSVFENDGATFEVRTSDETPTGYSGISNSTTFYLYYDASATAFIYDSTAPTWDDAKQGYYHPTNTTDRAFFSMFKDSGGTLYQDKRSLINIAKNRRDGDNYVYGDHVVSGTTQWKYFYEAEAITENDVYDELATWLTSGQQMGVYGYVKLASASNGIGLTGLVRQTSITLSGVTVAGAATTLSVSDGDSTAIDKIHIMSNMEGYS